MLSCRAANTAPAMLLGSRVSFDCAADLLTHFLDGSECRPYILGIPSLIKFSTVGKIGGIPVNAEPSAKDVGNTFRIQRTFLPVVCGVVALVVEPGLCDFRGK